MAVAAAPSKENLRQGPHRVEVEPTPRRVRVVFNGQTVADSKNAVLLRESNLLPVYYFPPEDVRQEFLEPTDQHTRCPYKGEASYWTIRVGDRAAENAMWGYVDPLPGREDIRGYRAFYWNRVDAWYEEDEQVFKHPRDPYHRVDVLRSSRHVRVEIDGTVVAETERPLLLLETGLPPRWYVPRADVRFDLLTPTDTASTCPYKGVASYFTATIDGAVYEDVAWTYVTPVPECPKIEQAVSFFNERVDLTVDGVDQERPVTHWSRTVEDR
jgi:uncharacterized protein (DUF427 family)